LGVSGAPNFQYDAHFFDTDNDGTGALEAAINQIIADGDTPRFQGLFWWQGESDGIGDYATANTSQAVYEARWAGLLGQLEADLQTAGLDSSEYKFVVNTVAESGNQINTILTGIANADARGLVFDTQVAPYNDRNLNPADEATYGDLHDYDHFAVGQANAQLLIDTFGGTVAPAAAKRWDGDASDGLWTSPGNWSDDTLPSITDDVVVGLSASVTEATFDFASLEIESGATVTLAAANALPLTKNFDVAGTLNYVGAFRPDGSTIHLSGSLGSDISWLDLRGVTAINFTDGSSFANSSMNVEIRGTPTFGFELSATGFTTIAAGALYDSTGGAGWSAVTFNIDVSNYDTANGNTLVLMDFTNDIGVSFNPTVNLIAGDSGLSGTLSFDSNEDQVIFTFDGVAPPAADATWDGGANDGGSCSHHIRYRFYAGVAV
jgi:hypothetical protein